ncbi:FK506-binding protein-like [Passerculus sandwichensis]
MEGATSANEGAALPEGANGSKDTEEALANQQRDGGLPAANEDDRPQGSANERKGRSSSANQDTETREVTNHSTEVTAANEDTAHKVSTDQSSGQKSPANQDKATQSTNQNAAPRLNDRQAPPLPDPTNDLTPVAAAANQARDPWDWSLEEAWLRAPEEEGLAAWGAELEGWEAEPDDEEEAELEDWEVELENCGAEPTGLGAELKSMGVELECSMSQGVGPKSQGAEPECCGVDPNAQGVVLKHSKGKGEELKEQGEELEHSKDQRAELKAKGAGLKPQEAELEHSKNQRAELKAKGAGLKSQEAELEPSKDQRAELKAKGAGLKSQEAELEHCGVRSNTQWAELSPERPRPAPPQRGHWLPSPDGAWSKLTVRRGRGLARPGPGSLCRVRLSVPPSSRSPWPAPPSASGCGRWRDVRLGSAEGRWAALLDAALETMAAGERAWLRPSPAERAVLAVQLGPFTPPPPFWAAPPSLRWRSVRSGHARAAELLAEGNVGAAGRAFRRALRSAVAAAGPPPLPPDITELKAELHAGLAEAQLRLGLPAAAAANAGRALRLRPAHLGARYARGVASAAMMDLEAAREDLQAVLRARPGHRGAAEELARVRDKARRRDTQLASRLGKMFA